MPKKKRDEPAKRNETEKEKKYQKSQKSCIFEVDTLKIVVSFLPKSSYLSFSSTNKMFREAFLTSPYSIGFQIQIHLKNTFNFVSSSEKLVILNSIISLAENEKKKVSSEIQNATLVSNFQKCLGNSSLDFTEALQTVKILSMESNETSNSEEENIKILINGETFNISYNSQDYPRKYNLSMTDESGDEIFSFRGDEDGYDYEPLERPEMSNLKCLEGDKLHTFLFFLLKILLNSSNNINWEKLKEILIGIK